MRNMILTSASLQAYDTSASHLHLIGIFVSVFLDAASMAHQPTALGQQCINFRSMLPLHSHCTALEQADTFTFSIESLNPNFIAPFLQAQNQHRAMDTNQRHAERQSGQRYLAIRSLKS